MTTTEKKAAPAKTAKKAPAKAKAAELASVANVVLVPLDDLVVVENIREAMDEEGLAELARDIEARGLLQPIIVTPAKGNKYQIVAGHRRAAAVRRTAATAVPAVVLKMSGAEAKAAQLAENIQRQDLSLMEEGRALQALRDEGVSIGELADLVHKSRSWVCKRIACVDGLPWPVTELIEQGVTEDPEIILALKELSQLDWWGARQVMDRLRDGKENRDSIRELLRKAKEPAVKPEVPDLVTRGSDQERQDSDTGDDNEQLAIRVQIDERNREEARCHRASQQCAAWRLIEMCNGEEEPTESDRGRFRNLEPEAKTYWKDRISDAVSADPLTLMFKQAARDVAANEASADQLIVMMWAGMKRKQNLLGYPTEDDVEGLLQNFIDEFRREVVSHAKRK